MEGSACECAACSSPLSQTIVLPHFSLAIHGCLDLCHELFAFLITLVLSLNDLLRIPLRDEVDGQNATRIEQHPFISAIGRVRLKKSEKTNDRRK
jgi:hypothetical protein